MHLPLISFLTELWHLLDVRAVAGHGAVLAALLFYLSFFVLEVVRGFFLRICTRYTRYTAHLYSVCIYIYSDIPQHRLNSGLNEVTIRWISADQSPSSIDIEGEYIHMYCTTCVIS